MNIISSFFKEHSFSDDDRAYIILGALLLSISACLALLSYAVWPLFTGGNWVIASLPIHWLLTIAGTIVTWLGMGTAIKLKINSIDSKLSSSMLYRAARYVFLLAFSIIAGVLELIVVVVFDYNSDDQSSEDDEHHRYKTTPVEGWDSSEKGWESTAHFYDNEPPPPFS